MWKLISGFVCLAAGLFMTLGFAASDKPMTLPVAVIAFSVAVVIPTATGFGLLRSYHRERNGVARHGAHERETEVLRLAGRRGGKLTVVEVVQETDLEASDAEALLQKLAEQGLAELEMTDSGLLVYHFADIERLGDKAGSQPLLDA